MLRNTALRSAFLTRVPCVHLLSKMLARLVLLASCFVFSLGTKFTSIIVNRLNCSYLRRFNGLSVLSLRSACYSQCVIASVSVAISYKYFHIHKENHTE